MRASQIANPFVRALLRSPAHRLASGSLALLTVTGRRSGREYTLPVQYKREGSAVYVVPGHPETKTWWRNLEEPAPVRIRLRGEDHAGTGRVVEQDARMVVRIDLD